MAAMFSNSANLRTIYVSNSWNLNDELNYETVGSSMFNGCTSLVGGNGTRYVDKATAAAPNDYSYTNGQYAVIDDNTHEGYFTLK